MRGAVRHGELGEAARRGTYEELIREARCTGASENVENRRARDGLAEKSAAAVSGTLRESAGERTEEARRG